MSCVRQYLNFNLTVKQDVKSFFKKNEPFLAFSLANCYALASAIR